MTRFQIPVLVDLLGRSENDPAIRDYFGVAAMATIDRDEYYGDLEFKSEGVGVVFNEAPWVIPDGQVTDPRELYLCAFHLYGTIRDGYSSYCGKLPLGIKFGDSLERLLGVFGTPDSMGGGGMSSLLGRRVPCWVRYPFHRERVYLHLQVDSREVLDIVTLGLLKPFEQWTGPGAPAR